jgi:hypothetical protein
MDCLSPNKDCLSAKARSENGSRNHSRFDPMRVGDDDCGWGVVVIFDNPDGKKREVFVTAPMMRGVPRKLVSRLARHGMRFGFGPKMYRAFVDYLIFLYGEAFA